LTPFPSQQDLGVGKDDAPKGHGIGLDAGGDAVLLDPGDEVLARGLELVEIAVILASPVTNRGLSGSKDLVGKAPNNTFKVKDLGWSELKWIARG